MIAANDIYENDYARFWFAERILFIEYKPQITIDLKVARSVVADRIKIQNGESYPVLCDIRGIVDSDKAGRDYLAQSGSVLITAVALIIHEQVSLTISNFYLHISKPIVPTKLFTTRPEALIYLKTFID